MTHGLTCHSVLCFCLLSTIVTCLHVCNCRLIIKSLLDKACRESVIEEGCRELHNLLAVIEHILMFRIKRKKIDDQTNIVIKKF